MYIYFTACDLFQLVKWPKICGFSSSGRSDYTYNHLFSFHTAHCIIRLLIQWKSLLYFLKYKWEYGGYDQIYHKCRNEHEIWALTRHDRLGYGRYITHRLLYVTVALFLLLSASFSIIFCIAGDVCESISCSEGLTAARTIILLHFGYIHKKRQWSSYGSIATFCIRNNNSILDICQQFILIKR